MTPGTHRHVASQFVRFAGVGAVGTAAHYAVLVALVEVAAIDEVVASTAGAAIGAAVNYVLNRRFTFESRAAHGPALVRFFTVAGAGLGLNWMLMRVLTSALAVHYLVAQVLSTATVLAWNFTANRLWTFADGTSAARGRTPRSKELR